MPSSAELVKRVDTVTFPSAPAVVARLSSLLLEEWVTGEQLAEVMALDTGISARVLRLSNSVVYRGVGVKSVQEAVLRIGVETVRDIVFSLSIVKALRPLGFDYKIYWRHSLAVAQAATIVQRHALNVHGVFPELYAAALLHDIGMVVMDRALGKDYAPILAEASGRNRPLWEVEREKLGTDHAEVGARLLEVWRLPNALAEAVRAHHEPIEAENKVGCLIHFADFVCNRNGLDHGTGYRPESCMPEVWDELGLAESDLARMAPELQASLAKADALLHEAH